jgi:hypothetical protein
VKISLDFVGMCLYIARGSIYRKEAKSMPEARHCMICGSLEKVQLKRKGMDIWLCDWCVELEWHVILLLLVKERQVRMLKDVARGLFELGVAVDGLTQEPPKRRVRYPVPGCKASIPSGG